MTVPPLVPTSLTERRPARTGPWGAREPRRRVTRVPPYEIHSVEFGRGAEALVLLHGLSGSSRWWSRNVPELCERYRVIIPDLIGFGRSRIPKRLPALDRTADLLADWLTQLELDSAHLVGHSMGGQIAIHFAARHAERLRRLVLASPAGIPRPLSPASLVRFAMELTPLWRWGDPRFLPTIVGDAWTAGPMTLLGAIGHIVRDDVRPLLPSIRAPTLIVWGERDSWIPLSDAVQFREGIPDARLAVLRAATHNVMVDRPADFNRLTLRFLQGEPVGR